MTTPDAERLRLAEASDGRLPWRKWGPYLSERQWGTVREDESERGDAWDHFSHDQARSRAYRWGEDGLAGFCDEHSRLCFALALWNGADPILKERLFGLTNSEGNHGEDVKECYFYLDATPTHSYQKHLYKYPQRAFPYGELVEENRKRGRSAPEYELIDTGIFNDDRYFDVFTEYAKASPEEILIRITVWNRGPKPASLELLPTLWFRNTWSGDSRDKPSLAALTGSIAAIAAEHAELGRRLLYADGKPQLLFTENETNREKIFGASNTGRYVKDAFHRYVIARDTEAVNPDRRGTKAAARYALTVPAGERAVVRLLLSPASMSDPFGPAFDHLIAERGREADEFYASITPPSASQDEARVLRQALAGMLWNKQHYFFDLDRWLREHEAGPEGGSRRSQTRNRDWFHMLNDEVISMPDKWEYPWYAAWDLAFHCAALSAVDLDFAKNQLALMLSDRYLHPNGQMPAYEWNFSDVNPPVHAWAALFVYAAERLRRDKADKEFLKSIFSKLLINFTWWVNRKDPQGQNVFEGGFLGLDNIGVFDRSSALPTGGRLEQADGTAWMALFSQNMLEMASELADGDPTYDDMLVKFASHFFWIASAMDRIGHQHDGLWDEEDGFFYDLLRLPDGRAARLKVRSLVGLIPFCAVTVLDPSRHGGPLRRIERRVRLFQEHHPEVMKRIPPIDRPGVAGRRLLAILNEEKMRRVLSRMLDENEFLSPFGIRSISRFHRQSPYTFTAGQETWRVDYEPGESATGAFGGNSNWRGPVWFPINVLILRALLQYYTFYGDDFTIECPTGSGVKKNLFGVAQEIARRLENLFVRDSRGRRAAFGSIEKFQTDPHWKDYILFYEYFHGDSGAGLGASHQTGWTGMVASLIQVFQTLESPRLLKQGILDSLR